MDRKKFFTSLSVGAVGFFLIKSIPFNGLTKKIFNKNKQVEVKVNPLAVSRKTVGKQNV